jgi:hypothetical protein
MGEALGVTYFQAGGQRAPDLSVEITDIDYFDAEL